ncbi:hypothetical protein KFZ58_10485 [Virgibacillus sp. NKC19-16]|uniref:hypothetical protein n=1 Tax=Virgibacillus salidurans TaxID=2831673 RepID=UPI001F26F5AE|nr:hypothetical protein [Virgibacillus sp. NKC19-16]UJL44858.1 hypothetical protein KFZ58_10485 [Virgibacillus sp. NKC19-16]
MDFIKKTFIFVLIILLGISIYNDLTLGNSQENKINRIQQPATDINFTVLQIKVEPGDTVLSIVERINNNRNLEKMDLTQILTDFNTINPSIDPHNLDPHTYYYFPLYNTP